ncbi:MAG: hypothetical protein WCA32_09550 [Chromatiaceae bacterium]|jgi:hypothetical protein
MTTLANLLVILLFLSALYTVLGLLCGVLEIVQGTLAKPHRRRLVERGARRKRPRRRVDAGMRPQRAPKLSLRDSA